MAKGFVLLFEHEINRPRHRRRYDGGLNVVGGERRNGLSMGLGLMFGDQKQSYHNDIQRGQRKRTGAGDDGVRHDGDGGEFVEREREEETT